MDLEEEEDFLEEDEPSDPLGVGLDELEEGDVEDEEEPTGDTKSVNYSKQLTEREKLLTFRYEIKGPKVSLAQLTAELEAYRDFTSMVFDEDAGLLERVKNGVESGHMTFYEACPAHNPLTLSQHRHPQSIRSPHRRYPPGVRLDAPGQRRRQLPLHTRHRAMKPGQSEGSVGTMGQGKGSVRTGVRVGQAGKGRAQGGERPMSTPA